MGKSTKDVSVRGETYTALRDFCHERGLVVGVVVSDWVDEHFDRMEAAANTPEEKRLLERPTKTKADIEAEARKHFTF